MIWPCWFGRNSGTALAQSSGSLQHVACAVHVHVFWTWYVKQVCLPGVHIAEPEIAPSEHVLEIDPLLIT